MSELLLETARLRIRPLEPTDIESLAAILTDDETMQYYARPFTREEVREWIARNRGRYDDEGLGLWALELNETGIVVGNCGPVSRSVDGRIEIELGWHVDKRLWGQGLATEAAEAIRDYCHRELNIRRLIALVRPINIPSRRVAEKIGMSIEKETLYGGFDHFVYAKERQHLL